MNMDQLTGKYIELRDRRSALKKQYDTEDGKLKVMMEAIEKKLQADLDAIGAKQAKTEHGTVFKTYKEYANVADFDAMLQFIIEHEAWDMFERRVSKTAVRERMEPTKDEGYRNPPPPGVNFVRVETVQVRRS